MRKLTLALSAALLLALASTAQASFGFDELDAVYLNEDGTVATQAGSHPFAFTTTVQFNTVTVAESYEDPETHELVDGMLPDGMVKNLDVGQMPGFVGDQTTVPQCTTADFNSLVEGYAECSADTAVGVLAVKAGFGGRPPSSTHLYSHAPIYNLTPPPGVAARIGFVALTVPITIDIGVNPNPPYNLVAHLAGISQAVNIFGSQVTIWGVPASPAHDALRGECVGNIVVPTEEPVSRGSCPVSVAEKPFLTLPRACRGPLQTSFAATSWEGEFSEESILSHDEGEPPSPAGMSGCGKLGFHPSIAGQPTSKAASSPTGLDFSLDVADQGLSSSSGLANSDIEKVVVTLPEGMSANPSLAEGLNVCTMADLDRESAFSEPGEGCPNGSKIGSVEVETPLLNEKVKGALYIAKPYENYAENSLLGMYLVLTNAKLGISVKQVLKVEPDPVTGQLTTVAEDLPQLPFSHFKLHFREGARSPLTTPQACGTYNTTATLYPYAGGPPVVSTSAFQIVTGPNSGPCPKGGLPPFKPGLIAGTMNNRAGSFSPFNLRMFRSDSEQEITRFSIKLPPGITGKLAGIPYCSDAAIEAAKARTGPHGGQEELDSPSCPKASEIGRTLAGAGVGPALTYAPGKVYLAGPYNGSNLSMVAITAGKVGPFDIGTVVIRQAFKIDPETAEVFIDSTGSDPIPHIIRGIPVHLRDIRAYVDKPDFVLNPTDCTATSTASTVLGSGLDFVSDADNNPVTVTSRFQAADCAALSFAPQLSFRLIGGTKRGAFPKFTAHLQMNGIGESGIQGAQVTLPRSAFIEQGHFQTICTRVQFNEGAGNGANCPAGSIYGRARAVTPILSEPLEGPVFLRANGGERELPDLVVALSNSQVDFNLVGFVDSVNGRLRNTFASAPDAPVTSFDIELEGGSKGLFVNSVNLCKKKNRAAVSFTGQNGKTYTSKPVIKVKCKKPKKQKKGKAAKRKQGKRAALRHSRAAN
jgi:hypothetical protein